MTANQIHSAILKGNFTERELRDLNGTIVNRLKANRRVDMASAKSNLSIGMEVTFQGKRGVTQRGKIVKINRVKCVVDTGGIRGRWNVPMTMLSAA
jgi:hypothetical protein